MADARVGSDGAENGKGVGVGRLGRNVSDGVGVSNLGGNEAVDGKERISRLFNLSNNKGNIDNQTVMILEF